MVSEATMRASLGRVAGVNEKDGNALKGSLVSDKLLKQMISPARLLVALSLPHFSRCPLPCALKVFKGYAEGECPRIGDNALSNRVGYSLHEVSLPSANSVKGTRVMSMKISRDALEIAALFAFLTGLFVGAGLLWWAAFLFAVGLVLLAFEWYLWTRKGETLSQQFWRFKEEHPKAATLLLLLLAFAFLFIEDSGRRLSPLGDRGMPPLTPLPILLLP
jgi:hypothetical protein